VIISITHRYMNELSIDLFHPDGSKVNLFYKHGGHTANMAMTEFTDDANRLITSGTGPFAGTYKPLNSLYLLRNKNSYGYWYLCVSDNVAADTGSITYFELKFKNVQALLVWTSFGQDGSGSAVISKTYNKTENSQKLQVNTYISNDQDKPSACFLKNYSSHAIV
jgi:subtilisin-like proprotein convertase family protein